MASVQCPGPIFLREEAACAQPGYRGPNLDPANLHLEPKQLAEGVYALIAMPPPKDNGGVIIGTRAKLVVDAGVNDDVACQIQAIAEKLSPVPLRYLANTTYHGDHTFGNAAFPDDVVILSSYQNRVSMADLESEKRIRSGNMYGNTSAISNVKEWRKPDVTFDWFYITSLRAMSDSEAEAIDRVGAPSTLSIPPGAPAQIEELNVNMHRLNVMATYRAFKAAS